VTKRLLALEKLSFLELYSVFIGKAQIVEMALKRRLVDQYDYSESKISRWTLGTTITELEKNGLRPDFVALLRELLEFRNYLAHEFLADHALMNSVAGLRAGTLSMKPLRHALFKVEEVIVVHDFLAENNFL
jgi:hypothetical protein